MSHTSKMVERLSVEHTQEDPGIHAGTCTNTHVHRDRSTPEHMQTHVEVNKEVYHHFLSLP